MIVEAEDGPGKRVQAEGAWLCWRWRGVSLPAEGSGLPGTPVIPNSSGSTAE